MSESNFKFQLRDGQILHQNWRDMTTHQMPLHSGEPRAQHAPRGPDGWLLPSLQPHQPTPIDPTPHTLLLHRSSILTGQPPCIHLCISAHIHTNCAAYSINLTRTTHDLHAVLAWVPHLHASYVSVQPKRTNPRPPCLETAIVSFSLTLGHSSVQAMRCLFINTIKWWWGSRLRDSVEKVVFGGVMRKMENGKRALETLVKPAGGFIRTSQHRSTKPTQNYEYKVADYIEAVMQTPCRGIFDS